MCFIILSHRCLFCRMFDFEVVLEGRENNRLQELLGANCEYPLEFPKPVSILLL